MKRALTFSLLILSASCGLAMPAHAQDSSQPCLSPIQTPAPGGTTDPSLVMSHRFATGAGIKVAVIDTGVAPHPRLGTVHPGADFIMGQGADKSLQDCDGHGTIVAGIIAARPAPDYRDPFIGVAPDAEIIAIRQTSSVLRSPHRPDETAGTMATLADAIHRAIDLGAHVINVSLASCVPRDVAESLDTAVLDEALIRAEGQGIVVVAAAGNIGSSCDAHSVSYPAASPTVLAVSASENSHELASYSLAVDKPMLSAPGTVPVALSPSGEGFASAMSTPQGTRPFTGTSFAAPVVSGIAALVKQRYPNDSAASLRTRITAAASPGTGHINPEEALAQLGGATPVHHVAVSAPAPRSTRIQHESGDILLVAMGCFAALITLGASARRRATGR
ncbi:type VII secretion-associated serine protease mycosin [Corynebacterium sp. H130]|uniref:type VII secretion-associated serine protease mycosin n=1 Tax=Corynebacterium sp. H130 TaxID=3133444 RepID=UPI0030B634D0